MIVQAVQRQRWGGRQGQRRHQGRAVDPVVRVSVHKILVTTRTHLGGGTPQPVSARTRTRARARAQAHPGRRSSGSGLDKTGGRRAAAAATATAGATATRTALSHAGGHYRDVAEAEAPRVQLFAVTAMCVYRE